MKSAIQVFIGLLFFTVFAQSGETSDIVVEYTIKSLRDIEEIESEEAQNIVKETILLMDDFQFELLANKDVALFKMKEQLVSDDIPQYIYNIAVVSCDGEEVWYTDKRNNTKIVAKQGSGEPVCLTYDQENQWEIEAYQKQIGDFNCYKATTVRKEGKRTLDVAAWFTTDIPYSFGPLGFNGLPGVILELRISSVVYTASKISLDKREKIIQPKCVFKESNEGYYKRMDERMNAIINQGD